MSTLQKAHADLLAHDYTAVLMAGPHDRAMAIDLWLDHCETYLAHYVVPRGMRCYGEQWDKRRT
jgi:hypothetical protein